MMTRNFLNRFTITAYRILLAYLFYFLARLGFYLYTRQLIPVESVSEFFKLCWHGLAFDTTAILYVNGLFIILSLFPMMPLHRHGYRVFLIWLYFVTNLLAYSLNFIDFIYYRYTFSRSTIGIMESLEHESNKGLLFKNFLVNYWHVFLIFIALAMLWVWLYKRNSPKFSYLPFTLKNAAVSVLLFLLTVVLCIGGIRGDFKKSTRPINLVDANRHVTNAAQADIVLNTPFAMFRTMFSNNFKKVHLTDQQTIDELIKPVKQYQNNPPSRPNVVVFILESNGREYFGSFNRDSKIKDYKGYTPFVDSLAQHSLIFTNAYSNGFKSIHAMSSTLAGIPSFKDAFTSSPYPKQETQSLVSVLESIGYNTSFFHGAPNGSMGFLGYSNILGIDRYYGKNEYNNDADFDGVWGIWDEPFFQYFNKTISSEKQPFMATMFSVSSHEPYKVPEQYEGKFPKGDVNVHQTIGYTDYALKKFFAAARKEAWFKNTIFVLVGDHSNTIFYDEYRKEFNKNAVAMMIYTPDEKYKGVNTDFAQQIDIYPTILDMIGYDKPFRSWGRSLVGDTEIPPFVIKYSSGQYQLMSGNYICTFDGKKATGFYDKNDKGMTTNLIGQRNAEMDRLELRCKAFLQDYMDRVIDRKLGPPQ
jgi:phosphoglycerol transferase MdoB-like AlkP superfamily enzyme